MTNTLDSPKVRTVLDRLFEGAAHDDENGPTLEAGAWSTASAGELADVCRAIYLDGWKDLCLPVLRLLEPRLAPGALVVADDVDSHASMADYLAYVRDPANGYVTIAFPVEDGLEVSCWTGA
jgi:predicted O-methyltransferase YrrM